MSCAPNVSAPPEYFDDTHDPNAGRQGPWRFLIECPVGVAPSAATVVVVDENDYPVPYDATGVVGDSMLISFDRIELATGVDIPTPNVYGVYFFTTGGSPKVYKVRCHATKNTTPPTFKDVTQLLICKNS